MVPPSNPTIDDHANASPNGTFNASTNGPTYDDAPTYADAPRVATQPRVATHVVSGSTILQFRALPREVVLPGAVSR